MVLVVMGQGEHVHGSRQSLYFVTVLILCSGQFQGLPDGIGRSGNFMDRDWPEKALLVSGVHLKHDR